MCCGADHVTGVGGGGGVPNMPSQLSQYLEINLDQLHNRLQGLGAQVTVMLCSEDGVQRIKKIHPSKVPFCQHNTGFLTRPKEGGDNTDMKMLHQSCEAALHKLWQSLQNIYVLQVLWGLPSNRRQHEQVMDLFTRTVMRVLCH